MRIQNCQRSEGLVGDDRGFGQSKRGSNLGVLPAQEPKILPRPPCGNSEVHQRALGDVKPVLHTLGDQNKVEFDTYEARR